MEGPRSRSGVREEGESVLLKSGYGAGVVDIAALELLISRLQKDAATPSSCPPCAASSHRGGGRGEGGGGGNFGSKSGDDGAGASSGAKALRDGSGRVAGSMSGAQQGFKRAESAESASGKVWNASLDASRIALAQSLGLASSGRVNKFGKPEGKDDGRGLGMGVARGWKGGEVGGTGAGERDCAKKFHGPRKTDDIALKKFIHAVKVGDITCVRLMLVSDPSLCCSSTPRDMLAYTPLHWASKKNHPDICLLLLESRAHIDARNREGVTPLHSAALNGCDAVVQILLENGADVNATDASGRSAESCALSRKFDACTRLFQVQSKVRDMTKSPAAWTKANMKLLLKLCGASDLECNVVNPGKDKSRHELEKHVRSAVPALANVWLVGVFCILKP